eukprot:GHVN01029922.1.p1 GENE.GHVN01029922.1~~GHVN01029922.1.p1  ORF type:complete len:340 (+),score=58.73 GHVN01029922.1:184-1203(+)
MQWKCRITGGETSMIDINITQVGPTVTKEPQHKQQYNIPLFEAQPRKERCVLKQTQNFLRPTIYCEDTEGRFLTPLRAMCDESDDSDAQPRKQRWCVGKRKRSPSLPVIREIRNINIVESDEQRNRRMTFDQAFMEPAPIVPQSKFEMMGDSPIRLLSPFLKQRAAKNSQPSPLCGRIEESSDEESSDEEPSLSRRKAKKVDTGERLGAISMRRLAKKLREAGAQFEAAHPLVSKAKSLRNRQREDLAASQIAKVETVREVKKAAKAESRAAKKAEKDAAKRAAREAAQGAARAAQRAAKLISLNKTASTTSSNLLCLSPKVIIDSMKDQHGKTSGEVT